MKYLKKFLTHSAYNTYINGNPVLPNVSYCVNEDEVHYNPKPDPYNGHAYVDLGLPSGTLWATMNVGASSETDYGNYYMYGKGATQYNSSDTAYAGTENPLDLSVDTARLAWGGAWHMPTLELLNELVHNTTPTYVANYQGSGVNGYTFTANNNHIFIPLAGAYGDGTHYQDNNRGYIWSSTPLPHSNNSYALDFDTEYIGSPFAFERTNGFSVRPVIG